MTREDFLTAVVAPIGNGFEFVDAENFLRPASDVRELRPIRAVVCYLMRDDQMMFGIERVRSTGQCNTACSLSAGVSKPKVFRGR